MKFLIDLPPGVPKESIPVIVAFAANANGAHQTQVYFHLADDLLQGLSRLPPERRVADIKIICGSLQDSLLQYTGSN